MTRNGDDLAQGARNLLLGCAELSAGQSLLIIAEPDGDYFDPGLAPAIAAEARRLGVVTRIREVPFNPVVSDPAPALAAAMDAAHRVLFLARLGDQLRFRSSMQGAFAIMCYALDRDMLASLFGRVPHRAMAALKHLVNAALEAAEEIHVTCPAGTDFRGPGARFPGESGETTVRRFPLSVFSPLPPVGFAGQVAQTGFLCATGSQYYDPPACEIRGTLMVHVEGRRITGFSGDPEDVARAETHYDHVANLFNLDRNHIHSFHAGIHPGLSYPMAPAHHFDRWSNGAFGNPRLLHFHTCGLHAPGEISLNIVDPTVRVDGVALWDHGRLHPERVAGGDALLAAEPALVEVLAAPARDIGLGQSRRLSYTA